MEEKKKLSEVGFREWFAAPVIEKIDDLREHVDQRFDHVEELIEDLKPPLPPPGKATKVIITLGPVHQKKGP